MRILIIPRLTNVKESIDKSFEIEENIAKTMPNLSIANIFAWSVFAPVQNQSSVLEYLAGGYLALSKSEVFKAFDVYIGFLSGYDFNSVDLIIYEDEIAYELAKARFVGGDNMNTLPTSREIVIAKDGDVSSEVYKRAIIRNFGA